ncbi:MAG: hypothetical protein R3F33_08925 [Planctomycetota bacterium]
MFPLHFVPALGLVLTLAATPVSGAQDAAAAAPEAKSAEYTDAQLTAAWSKLDEKGKRDATEYFWYEATHQPIVQNTFVLFLKGQLENDPYNWPAPEAPATYDPEVHAPAQPIPRVPVERESKAYKDEFERLVGWRAPRRVNPAFVYDYARRTVVRLGDPRDPERVFRNGLNGIVPDLDLGEALCQRMLDAGEFQDVHKAFAHLYSDRAGHAYPGISLYDAWSSGQNIEMPDVECLGIIHDLKNDWRTWVAPVSKQAPLYAAIEKLYVPMHRSRSLQTSLARCYLSSQPVLHDGYQGMELFLHHLWEAKTSDPRLLLPELPESEKWEAFLEKGQKKLAKSEEQVAAARNRQAWLADGERKVRAIWPMVLKDLGVLE